MLGGGEVPLKRAKIMCYHRTEKSGCRSKGITWARAGRSRRGRRISYHIPLARHPLTWEQILSLLWGLAHRLRRHRIGPFVFLQKRGERDGKITRGNHWSEERPGKEMSSFSHVSRRAPVNEGWPSRVAEWQEARATEAPSPLRNSPPQSMCCHLSKTRLGIKFL